jgi:hypothetical protein
MGTDKLSHYLKNDLEYSVIEIITGKNKEQNNAIMAEDLKKTETLKMHETAKKYGFSILEV